MLPSAFHFDDASLLMLSRFKKKHDKGSSKGKVKVNSRVEKEYLKSAYSASIGGELEDGLFDGNTFPS